VHLVLELATSASGAAEAEAELLVQADARAGRGLRRLDLVSFAVLTEIEPATRLAPATLTEVPSLVLAPLGRLGVEARLRHVFAQELRISVHLHTTPLEYTPARASARLAPCAPAACRLGSCPYSLHANMPVHKDDKRGRGLGD
jgi:hypothetical protein